MSDPRPSTERRQTVLRAAKGKSERFVRVLNSTVQDKRLSFRARGILAYVLSRPDDWQHNAAKLASQSTEGVDTIQSAFRELAALGYLHKRVDRTASGTLQTLLIFKEQPDREKPTPGQPAPGKPTPGQPSLGQPTPGKPRSFETTVSRNDCKETTDTTNHGQETVCPPVDNEEIFDAYPKRVGRAEALKAIADARKTVPGYKLLNAVRAYAEAVAGWPEDARRFVPHPAKWFSNARYDDDPKEWLRSSQDL